MPPTESSDTANVFVATRATAAVLTDGESARRSATAAFDACGLAISAWRGYCSLPPPIATPIQLALPASMASARFAPRSATWNNPFVSMRTSGSSAVHAGAASCFRA